MKIIETEYKGYKFRSRLEARWAVFFDTCGVKWEYEPEGFDLGDGLYYLPDFLLHDVLLRNGDQPHDLWVEVKGLMTEFSAEKIKRFANVHYVQENDGAWSCIIENPILVLTNIPGVDYIDCMSELTYKDFQDVHPFNFSLIDCDCFGAYPVINKQGRFVIMDENGRCSSIDGEDVFDELKTGIAYKKARQARFEHTEND